MERIIDRCTKVFCVVMIAIHTQFIIKTVSFNFMEIIMNVFAITNLILYVLVLIYGSAGKHIQKRRVLIALCVTTVLLWAPMAVYEIQKYGMVFYILLNGALQHFLTEMFLILRILSIKRLLDISEGRR